MLYLASGSPRRAELLAQIGVPFTVLKAPGIDETVHAGEAPRDYVARMAREKAAAGRAAAPGPGPVLGADTAVVLGERVLGKPDNDDQALAMLRDLQDREHRVLSAVCVWPATPRAWRSPRPGSGCARSTMSACAPTWPPAKGAIKPVPTASRAWARPWWRR